MINCVMVRRWNQRRDPIIHIATQTHKQLYGCIYVIVCEGEDSALAWVAEAEGTVPTCLQCVAFYEHL